MVREVKMALRNGYWPLRKISRMICRNQEKLRTTAKIPAASCARGTRGLMSFFL